MENSKTASTNNAGINTVYHNQQEKKQNKVTVLHNEYIYIIYTSISRDYYLLAPFLTFLIIKTPTSSLVIMAELKQLGTMLALICGKTTIKQITFQIPKENFILNKVCPEHILIKLGFI